MTLQTRKPSGKAPWPILVLAGRQKAGKSFTAAAYSASDQIDRTFWIEIGEGSADQYGAIPDARYEIVVHDGSYPSILAAAKEIVKIPVTDKPNAIVVDSMSVLWDLLIDEQQAITEARGRKTITMDQWNVAKRRWRAFLDVLRQNQGPVILTARYEQVAVVKNGKPVEVQTPDGKEALKEWKIRAEKELGFEADGTIEMPERGKFWLAGMRSLRFNAPTNGHQPLPDDFTLEWFMNELGVVGDSGKRTYVAPTVDEHAFPEADGIATAKDILGAVELADTNQLARIDELASVLKLDTDASIKGATHYAGRPITRLQDLTADEASRVIDAMQTKLKEAANE